MQRPVVARRGWVASELSPAVAASSEGSAPNVSHAGYQLARLGDGGWRATLMVPEDVDSMADIVLDLGEHEVHTSFNGSTPHILEMPRELHGIPPNAWKVRFSRKRHELSLEISGLDAKAVAELGGNIDLTAVTKATSSSSEKTVPAQTASFSPDDAQSAEACVKDGWTKPKETCADGDSWNTQNAPYGKDGRVDEFDQKVGGFMERVAQCDSSTAKIMMDKFGKDVTSGKKKSNSGLMFDQNGGPPKPMEIDEEAVDIAAALIAHSLVAGGKLKKLVEAVDAGVKVDTPDETGCTLLEKACLWGHVDIAKVLLEKGASPNGLASAPSSPLHRAAAITGSESQQLVQMLLKHGANKHRKDGCGRTAADIAEASGSSVIYQILLAAPEHEDLLTRNLNKRVNAREIDKDVRKPMSALKR